MAIACITVLLAAAGFAAAQEAGAPGADLPTPHAPTLTDDYRAPNIPNPAARASWQEYADLAILAAALGLASFLALKVRRRGWLLAMMLASLAYFGFYRRGCICPVGATQNVAGVVGVEARVNIDAARANSLGLDARAVADELSRRLAGQAGTAVAGDGATLQITMPLTDESRAALAESVRAMKPSANAELGLVQLAEVTHVEMNPTLRFPTGLPLFVVGLFFLPLLVALLFGRTFCAAVCPLGAIQDAVVLKPIAIPGWLQTALGVLPYAYLAGAVLLAAAGSAFLICRHDPFVSLFRLSGQLEAIVVGLGVLVIGTVIARPYCRFVCPYGALLRMASLLSWRHARISPAECVRCRLCEKSCPFGAIRKPTPEYPSAPRTRGKVTLALLLPAGLIVVAIGAVLGHALGGPISRLDATVDLAEQVQRSEAAPPETKQTYNVSIFAQGIIPRPILYAQAGALRQAFRVGGAIAGGFVGLVIAVRLVRLGVRRRRNDYEPDRADCLSCGRCFASCPIERQRRAGKTVQPKEARS